MKLNILLIEKGRQVIGIVPLMKAEYKMGLVRVHVKITLYIVLLLGKKLFGEDNIDS